MSFGAAKDLRFHLDDVNGQLVDISGYLTSVEPAISGNTIDTTTITKRWHEFVRGQADLTLTGEGIYDPHAGTLFANLATVSGTTTSYAWYPQGTASGKPKISGECLLADFSAPGGLDEAVTFSFTLQNSGTPDLSNVS